MRVTSAEALAGGVGAAGQEVSCGEGACPPLGGEAALKSGTRLGLTCCGDWMGLLRCSGQLIPDTSISGFEAIARS